MSELQLLPSWLDEDAAALAGVEPPRWPPRFPDLPRLES